MVKVSALMGRREAIAIGAGTIGVSFFAFVDQNEKQKKVATSLPAIQAGDSGENVYTIQHLLRAHDLNVTVSGTYDSATVEAVKLFQRSRGIEPSGTVDGKTWAQLLKRVSLGSMGDTVRALQRQLNEDGYTVTVNGVFDTNTVLAVSKLQRENGLKVTGAADISVWTILLGGMSISQNGPISIPPGELFNRRFGRDIDPYSPYQEQTGCASNPTPGTEAFKDMVLGAYAQTRNLGVMRSCGGSTSEHYEGRAWDWGVLVSKAQERQTAEQFIAWLLATDEYGNAHAMVRRLGIMYIIWNRRIWASHRHQEGWRSYTGANPHVDHVHFSFGWAGARQQTSFWRSS